MVKTLLALIVAAALVAAGLAWHYELGPFTRAADLSTAGEEAADDAWLDHLFSQNTRDAAEAVRHVEMLGERAVPIIQATLSNPHADHEHRRAALKAVGILGEVAAPAIPLVAAELEKPDMTAEAAVALSFMGRDAFPPLRDALDSHNPVVRREALRSIGKLRERAPLDSATVLPLLLKRLQDEDPGVRAVAATYLGIIHEGADRAVPALIETLEDPNVEVRRASAEALGSFGAAAVPALPALQKARNDKDPEVAREAGLAIVKLQQR